MPSSVVRHPILRGPNALLDAPPSYRPNDVLISPLSWCALGEELTGIGAVNLASGTYPAANRALGYPFEIADDLLVLKFWWQNGTTATTDRADVGVFTEGGTKIIAITTTPTIATANVVQEGDCTDTLINPGRYWMVYAQSGVTATPMSLAVPAPLLQAMGCAQMAAGMVSNVLVTTFVPAVVSTIGFPFFGLAGRTQVA